MFTSFSKQKVFTTELTVCCRILDVTWRGPKNVDGATLDTQGCKIGERVDEDWLQNDKIHNWILTSVLKTTAKYLKKERKISDMKVSTSIYIVFVLFIVIGCLSGCQRVNRVEFYEPTKANMLYCAPSSSTSEGHGPVKSIEGKFGTPDFSDGKSFNIKLINIGL